MVSIVTLTLSEYSMLSTIGVTRLIHIGQILGHKNVKYQ